MIRYAAFVLFGSLLFPSVALADTVLADGSVLADIDFEAGELSGWIWTLEGGPASTDVVEERVPTRVSGAWFEGRTIPGWIVDLAEGEPEFVSLQMDRIEPMGPAAGALLHWVSVSVADEAAHPLCEDADGNTLPAVVVDDEVYGGTFACVGGEPTPTRARPATTTVEVLPPSAFTLGPARTEWTVSVTSFDGSVLTFDDGGCVGCGDG